MTRSSPTPDPDPIATHLARLRRRAHLVLTIEALAVASLAPLGVIVLFLIATLLGLGGWRADLIGLLALIAAILHARRHYAPPLPAAIDRRIEHDSRLSHRPITAFEDRRALAGSASLTDSLTDPLTTTLWQSHRARTDAALRTARIGRPAPDLAAHDPFALRALLLLALIAAWIAAGHQAGPRLARSFDLPRLLPGSGIAVQAWITPPRWTGAAPILIKPSAHPITVLTGSSLALILTGGGSSPPAAAAGPHGIRFATIANGSYRATVPLTTPTTITIGPFWHRIARYRLIVAAPVPPTIGFTIPPYRDPDGKRIDFTWNVASPYGLTRLDLAFQPAILPPASLPPTRKPAPRPDHAAVPHPSPTHGEALLDLLESPYAGMAVEARLIATNKAGQTGTSSPARITLPAPILHNATARALEAIRQSLALDPAHRTALATRLAALATTPPGPITPGTKRDIASFAPRFAAGTAPHPEAQLWGLVQRAEQGAAFRAAEQLAAARRALEAALNKALAGHSTAATQLQNLLARLDAASQAHLAAQGQKSLTQAQLGTMSSISALAQRIADEAAAGDAGQAKADLAKLRAMLRQVQQEKPVSAAEQARQQAAHQAESALSKLMREEAGLMDRTARQSQSQPGNQPGNQRGNRAGQPTPAPDQALARAQQALQQQLGATAISLAQAGIPPGPQIGQGQQAMQSATASLTRGDAPGALPAERAAIAALQQAQSALQAMRTGKGSGSGPSGLGQRASGGHGQYGNQNHGVIRLGRAGIKSDARTIQNELIRRDAAPDLPPPAHQYYHRLLGNDF